MSFSFNWEFDIKLQAESLGRMSPLVAAQKDGATSIQCVGLQEHRSYLENAASWETLSRQLVRNCYHYTKVRRVEKENPFLILGLYSFLSHGETAGTIDCRNLAFGVACCSFGTRRKSGCNSRSGNGYNFRE
jgi:hypothetical protein